VQPRVVGSDGFDGKHDLHRITDEQHAVVADAPPLPFGNYAMGATASAAAKGVAMKATSATNLSMTKAVLPG
jgi:hypothetical protein